MTHTGITALILAGGRGSRMGGVDKGLQPWRGRALVEHTLERLRAQTDIQHIAISANRHLPQYQALGHPVWPDSLPDHPGPLAGFLAGLQQCPTPLLLTVPCDTPGFPLTLAARLTQALLAGQADLALAHAPDPDEPPGSPLRRQPAFCLMRRELHADLAEFLAGGGRKIGAWVARQRHVAVAFDQPHDDRHAFRNLNTLADLHAPAPPHQPTDP